MIFILPSIYYNYEDNINILNMYSNTVKIKGIEGSFPSNIMCGGINNLDTRFFALYDDILTCISNYSIPSQKVFINCGNLFLDEKEFLNRFNKILFEEWENDESIYFEMADFNLIDYAVKRYPNIQIALHQNALLKYNLKDIQNKIDTCKNIKYVILPQRYAHLKIKDVQKIYLMSFTKCCDCVHYCDCISEELHYIKEFSGKSIFRHCSNKIYKNDDELFEEYRNIPKDFSYVLFDNIVPEETNLSYTLIINLFEKGLENGLL